MQIGLRQVSLETVDWFRSACATGVLPRTGLARALCEREHRVGPTGGLCLPSGCAFLPKLAKMPEVSLPAAQGMGPDAHRRAASDFPDTRVACPRAEPGAVVPDVVTGHEDRRRREAMMESHHPRGWRRSPGVPGGIGFAAAGMQPVPRDRLVGWSADARVADIGQVVHDNRFLLLPGVRVKGLASEALRMATARVADDRETGYGVRPVLAQTFTGPGMSGPSCRAAGWTCCPEPTSGRRSGVRRAPQRVPGWSGSMHAQGDGRRGSMAAARTPTAGSGGGLRRWARPGPGASARPCRRSSRAGRNRRRRTDCCRTGR